MKIIDSTATHVIVRLTRREVERQQGACEGVHPRGWELWLEAKDAIDVKARAAFYANAIADEEVEP